MLKKQSDKILEFLKVTKYATQAVINNDHRITIKYHENPIATINLNDYTVSISNSGWYTSTTKKRINQVLKALNTSTRVYQHDFRWYVSCGLDSHDYYNGITFIAYDINKIQWLYNFLRLCNESD